MGIAYAGLGMVEKANEAGNTALGIMNMEIDYVRGTYREYDMARILVMVGNHNQAISKLEYLLEQHKILSVEQLKIDPFWDRLREFDEFEALINNPKYQVVFDAN